MASYIEILAVSQNSFLNKKGFLSHAVHASKKCMKVKNGKKELDLLVCCAIYRDFHLLEPALSSLILGELTRKRFLFHNSYISPSSKTFSFDLNNGPCGLLQGIELINRQINSGEIKNALLVSGDSAAKNGKKENYSFIPGAAALFLSHRKGKAGFISFQNDSYMDYQQDFIATSHFNNQSRGLKLEASNNYVENLAKCAVISFKKFLIKENLRLKDIDLVISSQYPTGFTTLVRDQLELDDRIIQLPDENGDFHSAAPLFALHSVYKSSEFQAAKRILFLTAGSGIQISIALYQQ